MDYVWDVAYALGLTSSPSLASVPIFPQHCQRDLHQYYEVDPKIIGRGSFASIRRVKLRRHPSISARNNDASGETNQERIPSNGDGIYDRYYACKTISKSNLYDRELFLREVYNLNRCQTKTRLMTAKKVNSGDNNNFVVRLLDVIEDRSSVHIVTELCEGGELFDYVQREHDRTGRGLRGKALSPLSSHAAVSVDGDETRCATIIRQILVAFRFLHEDTSVCHRDAKASNFVFVKRPSYVPGSLTLRVIDFGLSKFVGSFEEEINYRNSFRDSDNNGLTKIDGTPKPSDSATNCQEGTASGSALQMAFAIWNFVQPSSYFGTADIPTYSTASEKDAAGTAAQSEGDTDDGVGAPVINDNKSPCQQKKELKTEINPTTTLLPNALDTNNQSHDESLYSKHYRYMTSEVGTPYYVAPEVLKEQGRMDQRTCTTCKDAKGYTTKCDIWSVGVLAFLTLTGTLPVLGKDEQETIQKLLDPNLEVDFSDAATWEQDSEVTNNSNTTKDNTVLREKQKHGQQTVGKEKPKISNSALRFCKALLQRDPEKRPTARDALKFDWIVSHFNESGATSPFLSPNTRAIAMERDQHQRIHPRLPSLSTSLLDHNTRK